MTSAHEQIDQQLAVSALQKRKSGETPSSKELAALKRIEKAKDEENRRWVYRTISKKHYEQLSGKPRKTIHEQARYGLPIGGSIIDLNFVLRWFHDLLEKLTRTKSGRQFLAGQGSGLDTDGSSEANDKGFWQKRYQKEKAKLARLDRLQREGRLIDSDLSTTCWTLIARRLQQLGDSLQKGFGPIPAKMLNAALEDCKREVDAVFSHDLTNGIGSDAQ